MGWTSPGVGDGFPFRIPRFAEDGQPFSQWSGTLYNSGGGVSPSKSSTSKITVFGPGSLFCIKMTRSQVAEMMLRVKWWDLKISNLAGCASAGGDAGESHASVDGNAIDFGEPGSVYQAGVRAGIDSARNEGGILDRSDAIGGLGIGLGVGFAGADYGVVARCVWHRPWVDDVLIWNAEDYGGQSYGESNTAEDTADPNNPATYTKNTAGGGVNVEIRLPYPFMSVRSISGGIVTEWSRVIQVSDTDFWFAPFTGFGMKGGVPVYGDPILSVAISASGGGGAYGPGGWVSGEGTAYYIPTTLGEASASVSAGSGAGYGNVVSMPVEVVMRSGTVSGQSFAVVSSANSSFGSGASGWASFSHFPTLTLTAAGWWSYGGKWNADGTSA